MADRDKLRVLVVYEREEYKLPELESKQLEVTLAGSIQDAIEKAKTTDVIVLVTPENAPPGYQDFAIGQILGTGTTSAITTTSRLKIKELLGTYDRIAEQIVEDPIHRVLIIGGTTHDRAKISGKVVETLEGALVCSVPAELGKIQFSEAERLNYGIVIAIEPNSPKEIKSMLDTLKSIRDLKPNTKMVVLTNTTSSSLVGVLNLKTGLPRVLSIQMSKSGEMLVRLRSIVLKALSLQIDAETAQVMKPEPVISKKRRSEIVIFGADESTRAMLKAELKSFGLDEQTIFTGEIGECRKHCKKKLDTGEPVAVVVALRTPKSEGPDLEKWLTQALDNVVQIYKNGKTQPPEMVYVGRTMLRVPENTFKLDSAILKNMDKLAVRITELVNLANRRHGGSRESPRSTDDRRHFQKLVNSGAAFGIPREARLRYTGPARLPL